MQLILFRFIELNDNELFYLIKCVKNSLKPLVYKFQNHKSDILMIIFV